MPAASVGVGDVFQQNAAFFIIFFWYRTIRTGILRHDDSKWGGFVDIDYPWWWRHDTGWLSFVNQPPDNRFRSCGPMWSFRTWLKQILMLEFRTISKILKLHLSYLVLNCCKVLLMFHVYAGKIACDQTAWNSTVVWGLCSSRMQHGQLDFKARIPRIPCSFEDVLFKIQFD